MISLRALQLAALLAGGLALASCQLFYELDRFEDEKGTTAAPPAQGGGGQGGDATGGGGAGGEGGSTGEGGGLPCTCVDQLPPGVTGPFHVYMTDGSMPVPDCGGGPQALFVIRSGEPDATCSDCACTPPAAPCSPPTFWLNTGYQCDYTWYDLSSTMADNSCHYIGDSDDSARMNAAPASNGSSCTPSGGQLQTGDWSTLYGVCLTTQVAGACDATQVCIAPPAGGAARLCALLNDNEPNCPAGWTDEIQGFRDTPADTRSCTACTCGALNANCGNAFRVYREGVFPCGGTNYVPNVNECLNFAGYRWGKFAQPQGSCPPTVATVQGNFDPGKAATLCCKLPTPP